VVQYLNNHITVPIHGGSVAGTYIAILYRQTMQTDCFVPTTFENIIESCGRVRFIDIEEGFTFIQASVELNGKEYLLILGTGRLWMLFLPLFSVFLLCVYSLFWLEVVPYLDIP